MAKYDFRCKACKKKFEVEASMSLCVPRPTCPRCGDKDTVRIFAPTDFYLHGKNDLQTQIKH